MQNPVAITGVGVVSALGTDGETFWRGLAESRSPFVHREFRDDRLPILPPVFGAFVEHLPVEEILGSKGIRTFNRESRLVSCAGVLACRQAGLPPDSWKREEFGVVVATCFAGLKDYATLFTDALAEGVGWVNPAQAPQTSFNSPAAQLAIRLGAEGPNVTITNGKTAGLDAVAYAAQSIDLGEVPVVITGGVDSLSYIALYGLLSRDAIDNSGQAPRPFGARRCGAVAGEGSVALVLERPRRAHARGAQVLAEIVGCGTAFTSPGGAGNVESAAARAIDRALAEAGVEPCQVDAVFSSASGHPVADASEARALARVLEHRPPVYCVKAVVGECFGAGGAFQLAAAVYSMSQGQLAPVPASDPDPELPPVRVNRELLALQLATVLVDSLDEDGNASAVVLRTVPGDR